MLVCCRTTRLSGGAAQEPTEEVVCICGSHAGQVVCVALDSGRVRWTAQLTDRIEASVAALAFENGLLLVLTGGVVHLASGEGTASMRM